MVDFEIVKSESIQTSILKETKPKWIHGEDEVADEGIGAQENLGLLPTFQTWGYLDFLEGGDLIPLTSKNEEYIIGRSPSVNISLANEFLSPEHVKIQLRVSDPSWSGDIKVSIVDLNSTNGTRINNRPLLTVPETLNHQDVIDLVSFKYNQSKDCKALRFQFLKVEARSLHRDYEYLGFLGRGTFSRVEKARSHKSGLVVAIKIQKRPQPGNKLLDIMQRREITLMKEFSHPFVIELHDIVESHQEIGLVIPFAPYDTLRSVCSGRKMKLQVLTQIFYQVLCALNYLHSIGLIHRDVKLDNVLVFSQTPNIIKLADFGTTKKFNASKPPTTRMGTPYYIAPEIGDEGNFLSYTPKCDLFSAGVMFYRIITSKFPFPDPKNRVNDFEVDSIISKMGDFPAKGKQLLGSLLAFDPVQRLSADEALQLPFFVDNLESIQEQREYESAYQAKPDAYPYCVTYPL